MSQVDLDALEKLHAAAVPGVWKYTRSKHGRHQISANHPYQSQVAMCWNSDRYPAPVIGEYIAAAHNALPALIRELRALRELVEQKVAPKIVCRIEVGSRLGWGAFRFRETKRGVRIYEPDGLSGSELEPLLNFCVNNQAAARQWEAENV